MSDADSSPSLRRTLFLIVLLMVTWLLWSGLYKPLLIGLGVFSCLLTALIIRRMDIVDDDLYALRFTPRMISFYTWLTREIVLSSIEVSRTVLSPGRPISPQVFEIDASNLDSVDQAILGNSITLTPGTLTLDVHKGKIRVHSLTRRAAEDLMSGEMSRRVAALHKD